MSKMNELKDRLREQETFYASACGQLAALNVLMEQLCKRFQKAEADDHKSFRYSLRMRMAVLEGVRSMFYEFASLKANVINRLRHEILIEHVFSETSGADLNDSYPMFGRYGHPFFLIGNSEGEEDNAIEEEDEISDDTDDDTADESDVVEISAS